VPANAGQGPERVARADGDLGVVLCGQQFLPVERLAARVVAPRVRLVLEERLAPADVKQPLALVASDNPQPADDRFAVGLVAEQLEPGEGTGVLGQLLRPAESPRREAKEEALVVEEQVGLVAALGGHRRGGPGFVVDGLLGHGSPLGCWTSRAKARDRRSPG
jgi:hypothetical protein